MARLRTSPPLVFDYSLTRWEDEQQYNSPQVNYGYDPAYGQQVPRSARYGQDVTVSPREVYRTPTESYNQPGYTDTRYRRGSSGTNSIRYNTSSDSSPTLRSIRHDDIRDPQYEALNSMPLTSSYEVVPSTASRSQQRFYCDFENCVDERGKRKSVGRKADLKRHVKSVHGKPHIDCEYKKCWRRGEDGFCREDHYREHLRGYHGRQDVAKSDRRRNP